MLLVDVSRDDWPGEEEIFAGAGAVRGASIRNCLLLFPLFIRVLGSTVLFVIQVTIVYTSSLKAVEAGRIKVSRLPTRGRPWSSRGIRFALRVGIRTLFFFSFPLFYSLIPKMIPYYSCNNSFLSEIFSYKNL